MSERTPLLSGTVNGNGPSVSASLPSRRDVESMIPDKGERIKVAEVLGSLEAGKLPSQQQISKLLEVILRSDTLKSTGGPTSRTARLGAEGQRVLDQLKDVLQAFKAWGEEKNGDDILQNLLYEASTADIDIDLNAPSANVPSKRELSRDAQRAISSFRTIASLMVTNDSFRILVSDIILLAREILADAASTAADRTQQAAEKARPDEQEKKQGVDFQGLKDQGKKTAKGIKSGKVQGEARESIWDEVEGVKEYLDEKLPEGDEARDRLVQEIQKVVTQAQSNPEYRRSITAIVNLIKKYAHKAEDALDEAKAKSDVSSDDEKVQQAGRDLKALIERLANTSLDPLISAVQTAAKDIEGNDKLKGYFQDLENYVERLLYQPGYVVSQRAYRKATSLYDDAQSLLRENDAWKRDAAELQKQLEAIGEGAKNDQSTNKLVKSFEELADTLGTAGKIGLKSLQVNGQGLYRDIADVMVPRVIALIKEIPVPRIEFKSEDVDLVIDDIRLKSASFIPDSIRFVNHNDVRFTQGYATYASEYEGFARLRVEGLHFEATNIAFWVNKKTGFMPFEDAGVLDVIFGPKGISFDVTLEPADEEDNETFFTVKDVEVTLDNFDYVLSKNSHWFATWFAKPVLRAFVKRNLTSALEAQIGEYLRHADHRMFVLQQRAIAATNARPTALNFVRAVFSDSVFPQKTFGDVKPTSKGVVKYGRRGEYLLHIGVDEELFPNHPPAHISNQQRLKLRAAASQAARQTRQAVGSASQFGQQAKGQANQVADQGKKEANELSARAQEKKRREERREGWRSDAFDV
ncbi:hypothetical protein EHS25_010273 [Saitozyma podzolica]|uniref:HAM1-like N-terminal domain-containing protein n=1 Tax=Saitozyma podzolica TaxID=1890683 RepID=A0A427YJ45_9TREE|nr:hypothetical protein EHS25_010273 [Saitozyma podzolica]